MWPYAYLQFIPNAHLLKKAPAKRFCAVFQNSVILRASLGARVSISLSDEISASLAYPTLQRSISDTT